jgi:hypothetical protein
VEGRTIVSERSSKVCDSIRINREFDSNKMDESDLQKEKQRISTLDGITIE